jgi:small subunit ribosomal protein S15
MISVEKRTSVQKEFGTHKTDVGSPVVQVAVLTARIQELTGHLQANKKDFAARRGLLQMVGQRKKLLKYIADKDAQTYLELIKKLGLRR